VPDQVPEGVVFMMLGIFQQHRLRGPRPAKQHAADMAKHGGTTSNQLKAIQLLLYIEDR
jgi:hypothetical protein